jgi:hypothetical protein
MRKSYKITKYNPRNESIHLDWTSFCDIGKLVSEEEYLCIEKEYINTVIYLCRYFEIEFLEIQNLELYSNITEYHEKDIINIKNITDLLQMILREYLWCKLVSKECEFHFGYDYYMYFISRKSSTDWIDGISNKLFIEEYQSPYL